jgi:hypothetical protein
MSARNAQEDGARKSLTACRQKIENTWLKTGRIACNLAVPLFDR